jgi:DNA-binding response OmpR family regulator
MPRLLVVEDERKLLRSLKQGLQAAGFQVETAATGDEGIRLGSAQPFDCILLDWMLPGRDGLEVLTALRQAGVQAPVLLLTARDAVDDRVRGLESGADDYLVKPFAFAELVARIRVLLRRGRPEREAMLRAGTLEMDLLNRRVTRGGAEVALTQREFEVLEYLLRHKNETVTREMLGRDVWKEPGYAYTNVIDVYINLLRRKIDAPGGRPAIVTLRGLGYSLKE